MSEKPYIIREIVKIVHEYNPAYGDDRICECGHSYYRHFDSYEEMEPVGCKYCGCYVFVEIEDGKDTIEDAGNKGYEEGKGGLAYCNPYAEVGKESRWHEEYKMKFQWGLDTRRDFGDE